MAERNTDRYRSCWFYDNQLLDRMTSVSLHANTYLDNNKKWRKFESGIDKGGYCLAPLCTSILNEDFQVSISNTWNEVGGDPITQAYESMVKPLAPYAGYAKEVIAKLGQNIEKWGNKEGNVNSDAVKHLTDWAGVAGRAVEKHGDDVVDYMNSVLISQGTRFSYYSGSGVSFGNLQMRFTIFPIWADNGTFLSVPQQLELLFPYVMGTYSNLVLGSKVNDKGQTEEISSTLIGWQKPPAGYQAVYEDIDKSGIKGTLKLRIGSFYVLESLVCESMSFNMSRQMVKRPMSGSSLQSPGWSGITRANVLSEDKSLSIKEQMAFSPLFAEVILSFKPATKYSDATMRRFIYGLNIAGEENEGGQDASEIMKKNLKDEIQKLDNKYNPGKAIRDRLNSQMRAIPQVQTSLPSAASITDINLRNV